MLYLQLFLLHIIILYPISGLYRKLFSIIRSMYLPAAKNILVAGIEICP